MSCNFCVWLRQTPPHLVVKCENVVTLSVVNVVSVVNAWRGCLAVFWTLVLGVCERQKWFSQHVWMYLCLSQSMLCVSSALIICSSSMRLHERPWASNTASAPKTHARTHMHTHTHTHTRMHARAHTCTHTHAHARTHTHMHTHARTYTLARTHAHTCTRAHTRMHAHTHTRTRMHARTHTHAHTHAYTHTHTHTRMHAHTHACTRTHTHAHTRTHAHAQMHAHTHTQTHVKLYRGYSWSHKICQEHVHVAFNPKIKRNKKIIYIYGMKTIKKKILISIISIICSFFWICFM